MKALFADRLAEAIARRGAPCAVGLDPRIEMLPRFTRTLDREGLEPDAAAVVAWGAGVIEAVAPIVPVLKPQSAFYERLGPDGYRALERTIRLAHDAGLLVLLDVKRADIGSTAEAYAEAVFLPERLNADAATVVHYFGTEGVQPFLCYLDDGKGLFVVAHSSNRSAVETQDVELADGSPYHHLVGRLAVKWGVEHIGDCGYSSVGAVVGGTFPGQAAAMRALFPTLPFLIPGYGQQGAGADDVAAALGDSPGGAIVAASRSIYSLSPEELGVTRDEFVAIVAARAATMAQEILAVAR